VTPCPVPDVYVVVVVVVIGCGAAAGVAVVAGASVVAPWPTYGDGHCVAIAAHCSGVNPEHTDAACCPLAATDPIADADTHATWPSTGRLATVMTTGPTARPPRNSRRRVVEAGIGGDGAAAGISRGGIPVKFEQSPFHRTTAVIKTIA